MNKLFTFVVLLASVIALGQSGPIPAGMPTRLGVGLFEDTGRTWMKNSGVPWNLRYRYLTSGWSSNWGFGPKDGAFAGQFFRESDTQGYIPAVAYYEIYDIPPGGTGQLAKMQNATVMLEYFNDFKILMQQAKTFNKPVLVMIEADATGFMQGETNSNPETPATIASSGMPELASMPNTVTGWSLAFLQIRKVVGADKVILGMHVSGWASGQDIFHSSPTSPLQPAVDKVANFLSPLGLATNVTGQTYDVLVGDPLDRDADYYRIARGEDRWWDTSSTAGVNTKSFNRYAEWLRLWNLKTNKRWILWQVPIGNSASLNVCNKGVLNQGYKDNRSAYFFGSGSSTHRQLFINSGVIAFLFGSGESCQSSFEVDGNVLKSTVGSFFTSGGMGLPSGVILDAGIPDSGTPDAGCVCTCPTADSGTPVVDSGVIDAGNPIVDSGTPPIDAGQPIVDAGQPSGDTAQFNFEATTQGFTATNATVSRSTIQKFAGVSSLGVNLVNQLGTQIAVPNPIVPRGSTIAYRLYLPAGAPLVSIQVFAQENSATSWKWNAKWVPAAGLVVGWNTVTLTLPSVPGVLQSLGVEFQFSAGFTGTVYIDSVSWETGTIDAGAIDSGIVDAGLPIVDGGPITGLLMPLGDSITAAEWSWRCALSKLLPNLTFVGSKHNQYDTTCAPDGEGHPGFTTTDISSGMTAWLTAYKPSVVVLMIGTNDLLWWTTETGVQVASRVDGMVFKIQQTLPGVRIVVQTIPPTSSVIIAPNNVDRAVLVQQFNGQLRILINTRTGLGQRVQLADVNSVLSLSDLYDNVHPSTDAAINKMTPVIYQAVVKVLSAP